MLAGLKGTVYATRGLISYTPPSFIPPFEAFDGFNCTDCSPPCLAGGLVKLTRKLRERLGWQAEASTNLGSGFRFRVLRAQSLRFWFSSSFRTQSFDVKGVDRF